MALEIVFSGIELELYGADELPFVYWYAEKIIKRYLQITVRLASTQRNSSKSQTRISHLILKLPSVFRMVAPLPGCLGLPLSCDTSGK